MQDYNISPDTDSVSRQEEASFARIIFYYLGKWKLFLASAGICLFVVLMYFLFTPSEYSVVSSVVIKDSKKGQAGFDITAFDNFKILTQSENVDNEIEILRSQSLMQSVADSLGINAIYSIKKGLGKTELYKETPVKVKVKELKRIGSFIINKNKQNELTIEGKDVNFSKKVVPGELFDTPWGWLIVSLADGNESKFPVHVSLLMPEDYPKLKVSSINKNSSVVELKLVTACPEKGVDIINTLVDIYNRQVVDDKNFVVSNTLNFINSRLLSITNDLQYAEKEVESYKQTHNLTSPEAEAGLYLNTNTEYEKKISDIDVQIDILGSIRQYLGTQENKNNIVPINVGLTDPTIIHVINTYNESIIEKNRVTAGMKESDPRLQEWEKNILSIRNTLQKGIELTESSLQQTKTELVKQGELYSSKIRSLSTQEREARELYRQKEIKESLFLYLTQKKVETELALELTTPTAKIIDKAHTGKFPVKPRKALIIFSALVIGLIVPFLYLYLKDLFSLKLHSKEDIFQQLNIPFLGEIPLSKDQSDLPVLKVRSDIAEKFRMLSSDFPLIAGNDKNKVITVTSTVGGEGKSFISNNLALSLAGFGNKTLLIDLNLRKLQGGESVLSSGSSKGITAYLANPEMKVSGIIDTAKKLHPNLDVIPVKELPSDPAGLLASDRLNQLFNEVIPQYDYIVVDTPPAGLIADVYRINHFTDTCIYVVRADYTHKKSMAFIRQLYKSKKLRNMGYVLNGVASSECYGNDY